MAEWIMGLIGVLLCLFEGYCIQSFFGRFAVPKLCRIRNAGWAAGIAWIVIRAFSEGLYSDTDSVSLIMELLFTFMERSQEVAEERKQQMEIAYRKQAVAEFFASLTMDMSRVTYTGTPGVMGSAVAAYERNIMEAAGILK